MMYMRERISRVSSFRKAIFRRLGGLALKEEQKEAITLLLQGKDVLAVLSTGFGSLVYQSFVLVKQLENESTSGRDRPSCLFIVPLRSIGEEHINSNDFDLSVKGFEKNVDVLNEMKNNNFLVIYPSAGQALSRDYGCCGLNPRRSRDNCR